MLLTDKNDTNDNETKNVLVFVLFFFCYRVVPVPGHAGNAVSSGALTSECPEKFQSRI